MRLAPKHLCEIFVCSEAIPVVEKAVIVVDSG